MSQFGIKEVLNCTFFDYVTGAQLFYADYMADSTVDSKATRLELRGGQGNYKLLPFDYGKDMTFKTDMELVDLNVLGMLTGKPLSIGTTNIPTRDTLTASASNTITLAATPVAGTLRIYALTGRDVGTEQILGAPASTPNTYSITGKIVTLNTTTAPQGSTFVATYSYAAPATTSTITFTADKFAGYVRIVGQGLITDQVSGALVPTVFEFKKAKAQNNFTITQNATAATKLQLIFDLYSVDVINAGGGIDKTFVTFNALT